MNLKRGILFAIMPLALNAIGLSNASAQTWIATTDNSWDLNTNWDSTTVPTSTGTAIFGATGNAGPSINFGESVGLIHFIAGAQAYTIDIHLGAGLAIDGAGILNESSNIQTFTVENVLTFNHKAGAGDAAINNTGSGQTQFYNHSSAENAVITDSNSAGGTVFYDFSTAGHSTINSVGAPVYFHDNSTAGHATIIGTYSNGNPGQATFLDTSTAGHATILNTGGYAVFENSANAGNATITNNTDGTGHQGITDFYDSSDAMNAKILNENGSTTYFNGTSTANNATITNSGTSSMGVASSTQFLVGSLGGTSTIKNSGGGYTSFADTSNAQNATIINTNLGSLTFGVNSSAGSAIISNKNATTSFTGTTTGIAVSADFATITNLAKGNTYFNDNSSAGLSTIINENKGTTYFTGNALGDSARILNDAGGILDISGATTGVSLGAVEGAGNIKLGGKTLTITGLYGDNSPTISGVISNGGAYGGNNGKLTLDSTGSLTLLGTNTYTGRTTLQNGTLIAGNASAFGTGQVRQTGGVLETDNINHVITVGNNFVQNNGMLVLNINGTPGDASNDVVNVNGTAKLNGSLSINYNAGTIGPKDIETYTVITTTEGITSVGPGYLPPTLHAGALEITITGSVVGDDFDVTLAGIQTPFTALAGTNFTANQYNVASYLDRFDVTVSSGPVISLIKALDAVSVNASEVGPALDQLTPLRFGNFASTTAFNNAAFFNQQMDSYLANHRGADGSFISSNGGIDYSGLVMNDPNTDSNLDSIRSRLMAWSPAPNVGLVSDSSSLVDGGVDMKNINARNTGPTNLWNVFISGNVILGQDFSNNTAGLPFASTTTGAVQFGADYKLSPHWLVGVMFGYGHTDATLDTIGSNASVDTYSPSVYASYSENGWYANALGSYGFANYTQERNVQIGAFGGTATSNPNGGQIIGNLDGGYDFHRKNWTFGPTAGLGYTHLDVDGYTETGLPGANLTVSGQHADSLRSRLGWGVRYAFQDASLTFTPHLNASWQHEFLDQSRGITSQFDSVGAGSFVVNTIGASRDSALIDLGLDIQINDALTTFVDYSAQAGQSNYFGQSIQGGFKIGF